MILADVAHDTGTTNAAHYFQLTSFLLLVQRPPAHTHQHYCRETRGISVWE